MIMHCFRSFVIGVLVHAAATATANAGIIVIFDEKGKQYQVDSNVQKVGEYRISKIRWPDNVVNEIRVSGCGSGSGKLVTMDERGKKQLGSTDWRASDSRLVDKVATAVCSE